MRQGQGREPDALYRHRLFEPGRGRFFDLRNVIVERDEKRQCRCDQSSTASAIIRRLSHFMFRACFRFCGMRQALFPTRCMQHAISTRRAPGQERMRVNCLARRWYKRSLAVLRHTTHVAFPDTFTLAVAARLLPSRLCLCMWCLACAAAAPAPVRGDRLGLVHIAAALRRAAAVPAVRHAQTRPQRWLARGRAAESAQRRCKRVAGQMAAALLQPRPQATSLCIHDDGAESLRALLEVIDGAAHTLDVCTFMLGRDAVGKAVIAHLAAKARSGVRVRLLLDGVGRMMGGWPALSPLVHAGGRVALFAPLLRFGLRGRSEPAQPSQTRSGRCRV